MSPLTTTTRPSGVHVLRHERPVRLSLRWRRRVLVTGLVAIAASLVLAAWTMVLGDFPVPLSQVVATTLGVGSGEFEFVVLTLRLPRVLAAAGVGVALAASGAILQALTRNPLVAPDVVGITNGAAVAAVAIIVTGAPSGMLPVGAFAGALTTAGLLYVLTWKGGVTGNRLVLVGIGVNTVMIALTTFMLVRFPIELVSSAVLWQTGTLYARSWQHVAWVAAGLAILLPLALALMPRLRALQLGDETATALGLRVEWTRAGLLVVAAGLAAVAVAVAGPVGFVALMVPNAVRLLLGPLTGGVLVVAGLVGGLVVIGSDLVAQHAFSPLSLPVGVITAAVGAPYFLFLLYRSNART